jgi:peroxiredoxin
VAEVPAWAKRNNVTFPVLLDEDSHIAGIYNPKKSAPLTVLIDKGGNVVYVHDGYNPGDEVALEQQVAKVLDPARTPQ